MDAERVEAIQAIIKKIEILGAEIDGHYNAECREAADELHEEAAERLEFAFAELRAARHELSEAAKCAAPIAAPPATASPT